ncbi:family 16 glycosylhydrolase [Streptomyces sp. NPDC050560]|uniref:glycoside hydrolase family 16 protein n=1 Tax=Streptomyces sp. NPDC050560 TaxID=3365630 RepID=UPI0037B18509
MPHQPWTPPSGTDRPLARRTALGLLGGGLLAGAAATALPGRAHAATRATEVLINGSLASYGTFESAWNYLYPWGDHHNGSALMVADSGNHNHVSLSGGVLTLTSTPSTGGDYHYHSGTVYAKQQVTVSDTWPVWDVRGDFQAPSARGTWPAFWLTGANSWPPESDILEFKGSATNWSNTYKNQNGDWSTTQTAVSNPASWHTYRAVLHKSSGTDVQIQYYVDGALKGTHTGAGFLGQPLWLIIDLQMEGSSGSPGPTGTTYFRAQNLYLARSTA